MTAPGTPTATSTAPRDWWVIAGMTTAAASAAVASFTGLRGLATAAGWPARLAWLLPITIDAYAMTSARVWLAGTPGRPGARRFARANALGAIAASVAGNAAYHAIGAGLLAVTWPVIVLVGAVPATVLGLTAHLHALRGRPGPDRRPDGNDRDGTRSGTEHGSEDGTGIRPESRTQSQAEDRPGAGTEDRTRSGLHSGQSWARGRSRAPRRRPRYRTEAELMAAARDADARHRQAHGRPITRDALRAALRISGPRATELRRLLATSPDSTAPPPAEPLATPPGTDAPASQPDHGVTTLPAHDRKEANTP